VILQASQQHSMSDEGAPHSDHAQAKVNTGVVTCAFIGCIVLQ
jgi:hypothetical protein